MPSYLATLLADHRRRRQRRPAQGRRSLSAPVRAASKLSISRASSHPALQRARAEDGVLLMEVVITALIVGLIVVGTFTGIDVAQGTSIAEREHNEAILLASESQESLRSDPATTFDSPTGLYEHVYTTKFDGETYTVSQKASFLNSNGENVACSATNTTRQETNSLRLISIVTWPQQVAAKRTPITVSSITTPPTGSALEIDVGNYPTPTAGVSGVTTTIKYFPNESTTENSLSATTETPGCTVFSSLPATTATVEVGEKAGYVDPSGGAKWPTQEVTIAPNYTTHDPIILNEGGAIKAELRYKNATEYSHARNGGATPVIKETVNSDTIVADNELMESAPNFELGSATGTFSSGVYTPVFGTLSSSASWASAITTPIEAAGTKFPHGNLFPFPTPGAWRVYAGACTANDPHTLNSSVADPSVYVTGGKTESVTVPVTYMKLNVYTGSKTTPGSFQETTAYPVKITNTGCSGITPDDETEIKPEETQDQTITSTAPSWPWPGYGGHLEHPFLPFGPGKLCLAYNSGSKHYTFTNEYKLTAEGEYVRNIYLGEAGVHSTYKETLTGPGGSEEPEFTLKSFGSGTASC